MGFWDVIAPAWTNAYREGELQQLEMAQKAGQQVQSPYMRAWAEANPNSALARSWAHIAGLAPGGSIAYQGSGVETPGGAGGQTTMDSSAWQTPTRKPYEPPPPPPVADQPGGGGGAAGTVYPTQQSQPIASPRLIGPSGESAYKYPQTADTPENVAMEATKSQTSLHGAEEALKRAQIKRMEAMGTMGSNPDYVMQGYTVDDNGNYRENWVLRDPGTVINAPEGTVRKLGGTGGGGATGGGTTGGGGVRGGGAGGGQTAAGTVPQPKPAQPATPPGKPAAKAVNPNAAAIHQQQLDQDAAMFDLTPGNQSGQQGATAPPPSPPAPGAATAGVTPPLAAGAPGAAPPGVPVQTGVPGGTAPVAGPGASPSGAPPMLDVFGNPVTYDAPRTPPGGTGESKQLRPGGPQIIEKAPTVAQARLDMLYTLAAHDPHIRADIEKYGPNRAATIGQNSEMIDAALGAKKVRERGAPSLQGQVAHLGSAINTVNYLGQDVDMPMVLPNGDPVEPEVAGKRVSPFSVLTDKAWYAAFGERVPVLGQIFGPGTPLAVRAKNGDPRAVRVREYSGAVQSIVKGLGDVGNLSEGEQKIVADKLLPGENTTVYEAPLKQKELLGLLNTIYSDLQRSLKGGGTNVDGANAMRRAMGLPQIDAWSIERDNSRQGVKSVTNVIGATPPAEANTIGQSEGP